MNRTLWTTVLCVSLIACTTGWSPTATTDDGDWWSTGSGSSGDNSSFAGDEDDEETGSEDDSGWDEEDEDEGSEIGQVFWGEVDVGGGFGAVGWFHGEADGVRCEFEYPLEDVQPAADCSACAVSFRGTVGAKEIYEEADGACAASAYGELQGQTLGIGRAASGKAVLDLGQGWTLQDRSLAEQEATEFFFEVYVSGDFEPEDDEDDDE